jgi:drug/metabolite transporter (DMT)-like permease
MRKPLDGLAFVSMVVLCLIWALQQIGIKAVADDVAPSLQIGLRSAVAAGLVWITARVVTRERWLPGLAYRAGLAVGILFALEFVLTAEALRWTTASHVTVFLYTSPIFASVGLQWRLPDERLSRGQWLGIGVAFAGIVVMFAGPGATSAQTGAPYPLAGDFLALLAGAGWGATTVAVRVTRLGEAPAGQTLFYQLAGGALILLPFAYATGDTRFHATRSAWENLAFQSLGVSFLSYLAWFALLRIYQASKLGILSFMTPLFAVLLGWLLMHERPGLAFLCGTAAVLAGVLVVSGLPGRAPAAPREAFGDRRAD